MANKQKSPIVEGPMGLRLPEDIARAIEAKAKSLPQDFTYRRRAKSAAAEKFDLVPGERADVSYITTDDPDRDDEVVVTKGLDWSTYNGVVNWCHQWEPGEGYSGLPVGACQWRKVAKTAKGYGMLAKTVYHTRPDGWEGHWLPDAIVHLQKQNPPSCTGKSVGFLPLNVRTATKAELSERPDWQGKAIIDKAIAFEYSVTPVPCNAETEAVAIAKSALSSDEKRAILKAMEQMGQKLPTDLEGIVAEAMEEAAACTVENIHYTTLDNFRWALQRRLDFTDEHKAKLRDAVVEALSYYTGKV